MTSPTGRTPEAARLRRWAGFTLLELIVVLLVVSLSAALAAPALGRFSRARRTLDSAAALLAVMHYAQDQAANDAATHRLHLEENTGRYWLEVRRTAGFARPAGPFGRTFTLPESVSAQWDSPADAAERSYLQFDADGGHDLAVIRLTGSDGQVALLGCDSPGEPFRIQQESSEGGNP